MATQILATKLYIPSRPARAVVRPRLVQLLNRGLHRKLTLISAPAGFGKTTLVSEWVAACGLPVTWLSLDEADSDPTRFLTYLIAALRTVAPGIGEGLMPLLQSPQAPPVEATLTALLNEITSVPTDFLLVLDDYHVIDNKATVSGDRGSNSEAAGSRGVDYAVAFLIEHLPPQMHLAIATREDPPLPMARLRARDQLTELRAADLRFTPSEAASFLNAMGLDLSEEEINALDTRTEGWIAGLQLAAISLQGHNDTGGFVKSFTGSHRFVIDYLVEEVLQRQPESVQDFLLYTSILDRLCGPLCDAVLRDSTAPGQRTLEYLERSNMFIIPLDNDRHWYRYHHLFADLLRQRLDQSIADVTRRERADLTGEDDQSSGQTKSSPTEHTSAYMPELHRRASQWYEENGLPIEAFHHAVAAKDFERTARLVQGGKMPLHFRGVVTAMLDWLESLPRPVLDARPSLWGTYASLLLVNGQATGVEEKLQAVEDALQSAEADDRTRHLLGQIATARAVLAVTRYDAEAIFAQSRRALQYMNPGSLSLRSTAKWAQGLAHIYQGSSAAAREALAESISLSQPAGDIFNTIMATLGMGLVQESENLLYEAADTYRRILQAAGDQPLQIINEVHLGLARVLYEWNDLDAAEEHAQQSLHLARQYDSVIDRYIIAEVFLARLALARGNTAGAASILAQAMRASRERNFVHRLPEIAGAQITVLLRQGNFAAAADLARAHELPMSRARVELAEGNAPAGLATLEKYRQQVEAQGPAAERLRVMVLQSIALYAHGTKEEAAHLLAEVLSLAEPGGFTRLFVDEGKLMARVLADAASRGVMPGYIAGLLSSFRADQQQGAQQVPGRSAGMSPLLVEPLSGRELEVLQLIAQGLSNAEISRRLFLALDTVKGHNRNIFHKLQVERRTEAVARARELGLL